MIFRTRNLTPLEKKILSLFLDSSKRPKITPRHESAIIVLLEEVSTARQVQNSLHNLGKKEILTYRKHHIPGVGNSKFYYLKTFENGSQDLIAEKVARYAKWVKKYSNVKKTKMLGDHLQDLVQSELRAHGFEIINKKDSRKFGGRTWNESKHMLDIIAKNGKVAIGIEIKNTLYPIPVSEVKTKIKICQHLGLIPVFACRWMEQHRRMVESNNGLLWQFKKQLYPRGQEKFVQNIRKRFKLPVAVSGEIPDYAKNELTKWLSKN